MSSDLAAPRTMTESAREAARLIAKDQQKRAGKKVRVVATAEGFDGFKYREEGERFIAWWPDGLRQPSWQMEEKEYDKQAKADALAAEE